jgi:hypothetical protein
LPGVDKRGYGGRGMNNQQNEKPMYLKSVALENYGPYKNMRFDFRLDENSNPIPAILIGKNGCGKTIFLSHIVNAFISAKQILYENAEVEKGKVYKYRSPYYINGEAMYSHSKVEFTDQDANVTEWQLRNTKKELVEEFGITPPDPDWENIPENETSFFKSTFKKKSAKLLIDKGCVLYFPSNRFEEPGWLNKDNLTSPVEYMDLKNLSNLSNRSIVSISTLKECQRWLLDILLDRNTLELTTTNWPVSTNKNGQTSQIVQFLGFQGQASRIYEEVIKLLNALFGEKNGTLRFGVGNRKSRKLEIMKNDRSWIPNLFQLSSGEVLLLDLFLSIIRDCDLSETNFGQLSDIKGIVLIDEIDSHLHGKLQKEILPSLIKLFPKVQFVITTHSPMFLLGMQQTFGTNGFDIIEMPTASPVSVENFTEFHDLFSAISDTKTFVLSINTEVQKSTLPIVFVEGDYDVKYLTKTIALFYSDQDLMTRVRLLDSDGFGNLDKIWKTMDSKVADVLTAKTLLLYDCDITKQNTTKGKITRMVIPTNNTNPIKKGIENLLSVTTIGKLQKINTQFIDVTSATTKIQRGNEVQIPEHKEVNKDEKKNICDWLCQNGEPADFECFKSVVEIILDFLQQPQ